MKSFAKGLILAVIGLFFVLMYFSVKSTDSTQIALTSPDQEKSTANTELVMLEKWAFGDNGQNIAILVNNTTSFDEALAKKAAIEHCNGQCNMAYFYKTREAYDLHVFKRNKFFNPDTDFDGNYKKMIAAEAKWKQKDGHWNKVKENLIATIEFGEYVEYPYK